MEDQVAVAEVAAALETVTMVSTGALAVPLAVTVVVVVVVVVAGVEDVSDVAGAEGIVSSLGTSTIRVNSL